MKGPKQFLANMFSRGRRRTDRPVDATITLLKTPCHHDNVITTRTHPITLVPIKGVCRDCGECVKPYTVWKKC